MGAILDFIFLLDIFVVIKKSSLCLTLSSFYVGSNLASLGGGNLISLIFIL